jgi:hypothetical protein
MTDTITTFLLSAQMNLSSHRMQLEARLFRKRETCRAIAGLPCVDNVSSEQWAAFILWINHLTLHKSTPLIIISSD